MPHVICRPAPGVRWAVEDDGILLDDGAGQVAKLGYPEAAIWDLMARGYRHAKLVELVTHIAGLDATAAGALVAECLRRWTARGVLQRLTAEIGSEVADG
jgi:hypothetical protein